MEEKRKLEKIIFTDIDRAKMSLREKHNKEKETLDSTLLNDKRATKLLEEYKKNVSRNKAIEKEAENLGFDIRSWGSEPTITANTKHTDIQALYSKQRKQDEALDQMKRDYTLKLFAGGEEAKEVFENLAKDLAKIIG